MVTYETVTYETATCIAFVSQRLRRRPHRPRVPVRMAGGGTFWTMVRTAGGVCPAAPTSKTRKCRLQKSRRNFAERKPWPTQTVPVAEGEHPRSGRPRHTAHIA